MSAVTTPSVMTSEIRTVRDNIGSPLPLAHVL